MHRLSVGVRSQTGAHVPCSSSHAVTTNLFHCSGSRHSSTTWRDPHGRPSTSAFSSECVGHLTCVVLALLARSTEVFGIDSDGCLVFSMVPGSSVWHGAVFQGRLLHEPVHRPVLRVTSRLVGCYVGLATVAQ